VLYDSIKAFLDTVNEHPRVRRAKVLLAALDELASTVVAVPLLPVVDMPICLYLEGLHRGPTSLMIMAVDLHGMGQRFHRMAQSGQRGPAWRPRECWRDWGEAPDCAGLVRAVSGKGPLIFLYSSLPDGKVVACTPERG